MEFTAGCIYHIYNRGNDKQPIFFNHENYIYFLNKVEKYLSPHCDMLAYCLMTNHFHFVVHATSATEQIITKGNMQVNVLSEGFRLLLSAYTKGINKQQGKTGNLFQQNTKAKCLHNGSISYPTTCFHYTHQNPYKARLVKRMEDWEYSSFRDYAGLRDGRLCNKELAFQLLNLDPTTFYKDSYLTINPDLADGMF